MPTAESSSAPALAAEALARPARGSPGHRWAWAALVFVLGGALALRLWGIRYGLPYVYNIDEAGHFVPKAVAMSSGSLNPHYFVNPPALTYLLHVVFVVWFGAGAGVRSEYLRHPENVFLLARVTVALVGVAAIWLLYLTGARLFDRGVGLLAAALEAVAFLPLFYGHFALNDVPTLAPLTLSLLGTALLLADSRRVYYLLAGAGLGLACASKYTAGIALVPLLAVACGRYLEDPQHQGRRVLGGLLIAAVAAIAAFLIANPYALLDFARFRLDLIHQSSLSSEAQGKLGAPGQGGIVYYLWSLTWGLGWVPSLAALGGALLVWRRAARVGWMLVPASLLFLLFMGLQGRYFGRWLLPMFPFVCLLAAYFASVMASKLAEYVPRPAGVAVVAVTVLAVLAQGVVYSIHSDVVLARADTRTLTRSWMLAHVSSGARIVLEPVVPNAWRPRRWPKYPSLKSVISPSGELRPDAPRTVKIEDYELTLSPALIGWYERQDYCWVISGSTQSGRAFSDPRAAPLAVAYYRALAARARKLYSASPYGAGGKPVKFSFDWSFDYYPLAYGRPGPEMTVYRLTGPRCGP